ncbi:substrate-binding domain-containing protein [Cellulosimicrobium sp. CpK407]|uniref:substrate-binding domain-containing protein n=1 Tax=Cellulosimicrobium sp. CpK407 TaxID=3229847 RepID=UPI003F3B7486
MSTDATRRPRQAGEHLTFGVLCPVVGGFYFGRSLAGIARVLRAHGHRVVALQTYPADLDRDEFPGPPGRRPLLGRSSFDGFVVMTTALADAELRELDASGVPLVLLGVRADGLRAPAVSPDNAGGVRAAVDHLVEHGHTRIGFVGNTEQRDTLERYDAYRAALAAHDLAFSPSWVYRTRDNQEASAEAAARRLASRGLPTTATLAATDRNAIGFMRGLQASGFELPAEQAVVGFDHADSGARSRPRLSTVDPLHDQVGERVAELLVARARGENVGREHRLGRAALIRRESCGCLEGTQGELIGAPAAQAALAAPADPARPLDEVARVVFASVLERSDVRGVLRRRGSDGGQRPAPVDAWLLVLRHLLRGAADTGVVPPAPALRSLADRTAALRPSQEALEQIVPALEAEVAALVRDVRRRRPGARASQLGRTVLSRGAHRDLPAGSAVARADAVRATAAEVVVAVARGCAHGAVARTGRLEQDLVDLYEVDLGLLRGDGEGLRRLDWLPRGVGGTAALALWEDLDGDPGRRVLRVVGARGGGTAVERLVGSVLPTAQFPPRELLDPRSLTVVAPVAFGRSDWGFLVVGGLVDTRTTSTRERYNHWAAMLAVALDREALVTSLQEQRHALADSAERVRELALEVEAGAERAALVSIASHDGTWDWDVETGTVRWSPAWARIVGCDVADLRDDPEEWLGRVHPDDRQAVHAAVAAQLAGTTEPLDVEHRLRCADGEHVRVRCRAVTVHDAGGRPARMVGALAVLSDVERYRSELRERALVDPDSGVLHRTLFVDRLEQAIARGARVPGYGAHVLAVGLDTPPTVPALHRLGGVLGAAGSLCALAPTDLVVLLDGVSEDAARHAAVRAAGACGSAVVEHLGDVTGAPDALEVLRRAGVALARRRARAHGAVVPWSAQAETFRAL